MDRHCACRFRSLSSVRQNRRWQRNMYRRRHNPFLRHGLYRSYSRYRLFFPESERGLAVLHTVFRRRSAVGCLYVYFRAPVCSKHTFGGNPHSLLRRHEQRGGLYPADRGAKYTDPTVASLIMCMESVFAVLSGWIILGGRPGRKGNNRLCAHVYGDFAGSDTRR